MSDRFDSDKITYRASLMSNGEIRIERIPEPSTKAYLISDSSGPIEIKSPDWTLAHTEPEGDSREFASSVYLSCGWPTLLDVK